MHAVEDRMWWYRGLRALAAQLLARALAGSPAAGPVLDAGCFTGGQVRTLLAGHGFRVLRSSYWNTLLFPLMLLHRLVGRDDAESDVRDYPRWLDALFSAALAAERAAIALGIGLPFGGSLIVVAARDG